MTDDVGAEVIIVDDDPSVQRALNRLLSTHGFRVRSYCSARDFLDHRAAVPAVGCLVLDVAMPGKSGLELQGELQRLGVRLPVVFITGHGTVPMGVQAMKHGAVDFLQKPFDSRALLDIVRKAVESSREQSSQALECQDLESRFLSLSEREREVYRLLIKGLLNKQVGAELGIVEKTVKVHRARLMEKMQAHSLAELIRMAETLRRPPCSSSIFSSPRRGPS
jgi:FixJ family two-component response regulator